MYYIIAEFEIDYNYDYMYGYLLGKPGSNYDKFTLQENFINFGCAIWLVIDPHSINEGNLNNLHLKYSSCHFKPICPPNTMRSGKTLEYWSTNTTWSGYEDISDIELWSVDDIKNDERYNFALNYI